MKKIIALMMVFVFGIAPAFADELHLDKETKYQKKVMEIGFRILNANQIEKRMTFLYNNKKDINAASYKYSKLIEIYKGLIPFFDDDSEIAAILSHEIAHGLDFYAGPGRRIAMNINSVKYEKKADLKAVDLMVNAGYNPVALIIIMNKIAAEPQAWDKFTTFLGGLLFNVIILPTHPNGSERVAYIYEYIYAKYPAYLADNDYKTNLYYQNFLLTSKKERELIRQKYNKDNVVPVSSKKKK